MKFTAKILSAFVVTSFFLALSCNKEDAITHEKLERENQSSATANSSQVIFRSGEPCVAPYYEIFKTHFEQFRGEDPAIYFREEAYADFLDKMEVEQQKIETMGFNSYVNKMHTDGRITSGSKALLLHIHSSVDIDGNVIIKDLKTDLAGLFNPEAVGNTDPFYCYIYNIAMEIYNNYYAPGSVIDRGDCPFKDFVKHVIEYASAGAQIGTYAGQFIQSLDSLFVIKALGATIEVGGAVVGGAIGAIVGLFTFDDDACSDCHAVNMISVTSDDDCDLTRTLRAVGAGPDALAFEWRVTQGGATVTFTTLSPLLTVTQNNSNEPIGVSVASLCLPDGENSPSLTPFTATVFIDLSTAANSPLGQPGQITITTHFYGIYEYDDPIHDNPSGSGTSVPNQVGSYSSYAWTNSYEAGGVITHTATIEPASLGNFVELSDGQAKVQWAQSGSGVFRVTAMNICSGLSTSESIDVTVE